MNNSLANICTDLETSATLNKLGIQARTDFYWQYNDDYLHEDNGEVEFVLCLGVPMCNPDVAAYTLEQMLHMLPAEIEHNGISYVLDVCLFVYVIHYTDHTHSLITVYLAEDKTENLATSAARLLIKLKEQRLVK